jgi:hypothetical protein
VHSSSSSEFARAEFARIRGGSAAGDTHHSDGGGNHDLLTPRDPSTVGEKERDGAGESIIILCQSSSLPGVTAAADRIQDIPEVMTRERGAY